ncbi:MAG: alanine--tRNA ligase [Polyangiaceae bacterium]|nr:alanine--tRNA ligase [Polyangiaceae bacterium]
MSKTANELRQSFLQFFRRNGHEVVASGPLVPANDPTLMFANAGMVQFKDVFTGRERRAYARATTSQKCIRISGKHNDLEAVGPSPRHHTFFEMLGNFSFGDYFKEDAIVFAWDFLVKELGLPTDRLICTYFRGDESVPADEFARDTWKKVTGFGDDRVRGLGREDNFWAMGETGPCGPCSEIYFCQGPELRMDLWGEEQTPEGNGWMEIWNLVFMQFERSSADGQATLAPLPAPSIDTGAGLERLASVLQDKTSNYETDLLQALIDRSAAIAQKPYGASMAPDDVSMRVIADHARTTAFLIAEGIMPEKTGREYVLRRVMRRAIRHGHRLGIARPFLHEIALEVAAMMGEQYPELAARRALIASVTEQEEVRFRATIERGLGLLEEHFTALGAEGKRELDGKSAFMLYDTYGFPLDLTEVICTERGYAVDLEAFDAALAEARERSQFKGVEQAVEAVYRDAAARLEGGTVAFTGYERQVDRGRILALIVDGALADTAGTGAAVEIVTDRTPFYGEQGGQVGDRGRITTESGAVVEIEDTQKPINGFVVHRGRVTDGEIEVREEVMMAIDVGRRDAIRRAHSATHLMHWALRRTLGPHAQQKGSVVSPDRLRFDFTHGASMTPEQIQAVEDLVNAAILHNSAVRTEVLTMDEARQRGAMMIFEEKYGETVRMLSMAESVELCGGTHARATGDIGLFKILGEQGIAAGVRRILATTGAGSLDHLRQLEQRLERAAKAAKSSPTDLCDKLEKILARERALEKEVEELQKRLLTGGGGGGLDALLARAREIGGVKVLGVRTDVTDRGALRELAEQLRDRLGDSVVLLGSVSDGKAQLVLMVAKAVTARLRAGDLIRPIAALVGGSGGGRPDMAQAGGTDPSALETALEAVYGEVEKATAG